MYMLNGWWFLSSGGSYPPVFMVDLKLLVNRIHQWPEMLVMPAINVLGMLPVGDPKIHSLRPQVGNYHIFHACCSWLLCNRILSKLKNASGLVVT